MRIEKFGTYTVAAHIEGQPDKRVSFRIIQGIVAGIPR